jgi:hypothetical protein
MDNATDISTNGDQPWYGDGLRFKCTGCGNCCTGSPGYVWVNQAEIDALAKHLDMKPDDFEKQYVRRIGVRRSLKELPGRNYDCVFLDHQTRQCTVYEHRPRQCRTWPFWNSNIATPDAWQHTCEVCPGSGHGKLYQLESIQQQASVIKI